MNKTVCFYHANCFDGMAAAWVVHRKYPDAEMIPAQYGNRQLENNIIQDCMENANINYDYIIVDFSFPRAIMELMASKAKSMIVLDHHQTAQAACQGLPYCIFDMNRSGAGMAWDHFFPKEARPALVSYVEDRDLWRFRLFASRFINAYIQSFPMNLGDYDVLYNQLTTPAGLNNAMVGGESIERYKETMVEAICKHVRFEQVGQYIVPVVMAPLLFSEIGHFLCINYPEYKFAASWFIRNDGVKVYSLRSVGDFDVSDVAKQYGGGGHKNAAGFQVVAELGVANG